MQILYKLINDKAEKTFDDEISVKNWYKWQDHWFATARDLVKEFSTEGLHETVKYLNDMIYDQELLRIRTKERGGS